LFLPPGKRAQKYNFFFYGDNILMKNDFLFLFQHKLSEIYHELSEIIHGQFMVNSWSIRGQFMAIRV